MRWNYSFLLSFYCIKRGGRHMNYRNNIFESEHHVIGTDIRYALPHHDNSIEIIQTWSDGGYFIVKNNIFPIKPGSIFIINAMEIHYSNPADPNVYNRSKLIVSTEFFKTICHICGLEDFAEENIFQAGGICYNASMETAKNIDRAFRDVAYHFQNSDAISTQVNVVLGITSILSNLIINKNEEPIQDTKHTINLLAKYVNEHNNDWENLSLDSICTALHISASRASHLFKELMGKTIIQYKNELRIAEAKKLLLSTNLKILEISDILGFQHCTIFCKYFKEMVGCTPKQYRDSKGVSFRSK